MTRRLRRWWSSGAWTSPPVRPRDRELELVGRAPRIVDGDRVEAHVVGVGVLAAGREPRSHVRAQLVVAGHVGAAMREHVARTVETAPDLGEVVVRITERP